MSTTSPILGLPIPDGDSPGLPPLHFQSFSDRLDPLIPGQFATVADRDSKWSSWSTVNGGAAIPNGASCWCSDVGAFFDHMGGAWKQRLPQTGLVLAGEMTTSQSSSTATLARIVGGTNLTATLTTGRAYRWRWSSFCQTDTAGAVLALQGYGAAGTAAGTNNTLIASGGCPLDATGGPGARILEFSDLFTVATSGTKTFSAYLARTAGSGVVTVTGRPRTELEDVGLASALTGSFTLLP